MLGVACALVAGLVVGLARLLDYASEEPDGEQATAVAGSPSARPSAEQPRTTKQREQRERGERTERRRDHVGQARPEGPCRDDDVLVTPTVADAHAGSPVEIVLEVTTVETEACFFEVGPESVFVNVDGEEGTLWSSQHCPAAVPTETVVARREKAAKVSMWWDGKLSDEGCPRWSPWVEEVGGYTAIAAVRGSVTPVAIGFFLGTPVAPTVTKTATPTPTPKGDESRPDRPRDEQRD